MNERSRQSGSLISIGEASRRSGFSIKALRFYERRGLLQPPDRRPNGYRAYRETDLGRLSFIRDAKALGLTLGAIGQILRVSEIHRRREVLQVLDARIAESSERIDALTRLRDELKHLREMVVDKRRCDRNSEYCTCLKKSDGS